MRIKVLILNGSTSATIQALTLLDADKYEIHVCDANPFCGARFHRHCAKYFLSPKLGEDPEVFYQFVLNRIKSEKYDLILPVHEEGLILAENQKEIQKYSKIFLGDGETFKLLMNKKLCLERAKKVGIPVPKIFVGSTYDQLSRQASFPCYIKTPYGTSSSGVIRIESNDELKNAMRVLLGQQEYILQQEIIGTQSTVQAVFSRGTMIVSHSYVALSTGFGGGASFRESSNERDIAEYTAALGKDVNWTGPLMLDFIRESKSREAYLIEGNPRIGETFNAFLSGINIPEGLIELSLGKRPMFSATKSGTRSHQMFTEVTGMVKRQANLYQKYAVAFSAALCLKKYRGSVDEFIHPIVDPGSLLITLLVFLTLPFLTKSFLSEQNRRSVASFSYNPRFLV